MRAIIYLLLLLIASSGVSRPLLFQASTCGSVDVQAAINAASPGATVTVPAGSCNWTNPSSNTPAVNITKAITLQGAGVGVTIITDTTGTGSGEVPLDTSADNYRVTGFTFKTSEGANFFSGYVIGHAGYRVDHCEFTNTSGANRHTIEVQGYGVIDSNIFNDRAEIAVWGIDSSGIGSDANVAGWNTASSIGGANNTFVENNTFTWGSAFGDGIVDGYNGARIVVRYNDIVNTQWGVHGLDSGDWLRSTFSWEFYNNTFVNNNAVIFQVFNARGGSGVVHHNTVSAAGGSYNGFAGLQSFRSDDSYMASPWGNCNGSSQYDQNTSGQQGYACRDQIGRSTNQALDPVYEWSNTFKGGDGDLFPDCVSRCTTYHIIENREFYNDTVRPGYTIYACPHPLTGYTGTCNDTAGAAGYNVAGGVSPTGSRTRMRR